MENNHLPSAADLGSCAILSVGSSLKDGKRISSLTIEGGLLDFADLEPGNLVIAWASHGSLFIDRLSNGIDQQM
ncbi:hypothetical protein WM40_25085 [Robbsia andropogonis]|uniref:Uncharacterized protein n=1 Tax=Robbsia andropogonis TaxID=28092 RepID=A0A0F5JUY3_9BURK|nr:hypothetical protein [Robbsia andropogonis]KKB61112.1 hypothetical protein WM40_25085 [Robbsia andropogonis]